MAVRAPCSIPRDQRIPRVPQLGRCLTPSQVAQGTLCHVTQLFRERRRPAAPDVPGLPYLRSPAALDQWLRIDPTPAPCFHPARLQQAPMGEQEGGREPGAAPPAWLGKSLCPFLVYLRHSWGCWCMPTCPDFVAWSLLGRLLCVCAKEQGVLCRCCRLVSLLPSWATCKHEG